MYALILVCKLKILQVLSQSLIDDGLYEKISIQEITLVKVNISKKIYKLWMRIALRLVAFYAFSHYHIVSFNSVISKRLNIVSGLMVGTCYLNGFITAIA